MPDTSQREPHAAAIYRGMDRATLDAAYNNSVAVVDSAQRLADWQRRSVVMRAMPGARLDIAYGNRERTRLDYLPADASGVPLFVFIHGGYWQRNSKDIFAFVAEGPLAHGINVAMLGYTLAPEARLSDIVMEIRDALAFLDSNAAQFGFCREAVFVGGWSAGGHLAALGALQSNVQGAIAVSGIFDLEPIALTYINDKLRLDRTEIETLSPMRLFHEGMAPLRLVVGGDELSELQRQSRSFAALAAARAMPVTLRTLPGHHHFSILEELAKPDGAVTEELVGLMSQA
jgi:arylformamidase